MTNALAVREKEDSATSCTNLANLSLTCTQMDAEVLGEYVEQNWDNAVGTVSGLMYLVKEMKRRFSLLDRKRQVNGEYLTIRGYKSFDKWFTSFTGKSRRLAYYLLEGEEKKHKRNAERRTSEKKKDTDFATFAARCDAAKKRLADFQRQRNAPLKEECDQGVNFKALYERTDPDPVINEVFVEFLALISPDGYEVSKADKGWNVTAKDKIIIVTPEQQKAKRSATAKKAAATRAAKKAAAQPAPAASLGECESCCDGTLATEVVGVTEFNSDGYKYCAKCADDNRKYDRKYLIRQMGVAKVMGKFYTIETLVRLGGKPMDFGDGDVRTYPTVEDYLARLKEKFLGNPRYDQTVVKEHIARLEKKMEAAQ